MKDALVVMSATPRTLVTAAEANAERKRFADLVADTLVKGTDYDIVPGTDKPTLLQPGADKLLKAYGLVTRMELVGSVEDWEKPFFMYRYRASVIWPRKMEDGSIREEVLSQCEGSCNSKEIKYAWRWANEDELTPAQLLDAKGGLLKVQGGERMIFEWKMTEEERTRSIAENWRRESKTSKAGKPYKVVYDPHGKKYRIPNEGVFDQVNTMQKMAQKRARVGAAIQGTNASDMFTQDMEDMVPGGHVPSPPPPTDVEHKEEPQNGTQGAKQGHVVVDAEILDGPHLDEKEPKEEKPKPVVEGSKEEGDVMALMDAAANEAMVEQAWQIAFVNQDLLGPKGMKRIRDRRDERKAQLKGGKA